MSAPWGWSSESDGAKRWDAMATMRPTGPVPFGPLHLARGADGQGQETGDDEQYEERRCPPPRHRHHGTVKAVDEVAEMGLGLLDQ